jgi:acyl carrier protein
VGPAGELFLGGAGVARGYHGRPDLTAERFLPDPTASQAGARLYRTGDVARWLSDGRLVYLGRADHQVKVRGYRIEPGEIEAVLCRHPAVRQAVVVTHEDAPGEARLAAYFVAAEGQAVSTGNLRAALREELPDYMIPSFFVPLDALPLTPNGKVDRKALPAPDGGRPDSGRLFVAPEGPVQERLAALWAAVLRVERVGAQDNFFELGGHSLMATQVLSRVHEAFGVELPLRAMFDNPTVAGLAEVLLQKELERADDRLLAELLAQLEAEPELQGDRNERE